MRSADKGLLGSAATVPDGPAVTVQAVLEVRRQDPERDTPAPASELGYAPVDGHGAPARWQRYEVELPAGSTVLEALMHVQERIDGSLAFRRSCRHGICGSCGMRVNGCARLACTTQLSLAVAEAERRAARAAGVAASAAWLGSAGSPAQDAGPVQPVVRVEPLGNMPVIKDLVTDMTVFWEKLRGVQPWLQSLNERSRGDAERLMAPHEQAVLAEGVLCVECGACYSDCIAVEASPDFVGPTALVKAYRYSYDVRDDQTHRRLYDLNGEHGLWECTRCYTCTQRCPKHLRVRELIGRLAELAQVEGLRTDAAVKRAHAFINDIERTGRLDERTLAFEAGGALHAVAGVRSAARAVAAGKVKPGAREAVSDVELVRRICDRLSSGGDPVYDGPDSASPIGADGSADSECREELP
jgi:succinate dehydrogenase / fumarate reductase iron-sulfur subunit